MGEERNKPKRQKQSEESKTNSFRSPLILKKKKIYIDRIIKDRITRHFWKLFETEEEEIQEIISNKKERNDRIIKDKIIRDIRAYFEQEDNDYFKPKKVSNFWYNNYIKYEST